jgi:hypothetical protein
MERLSLDDFKMKSNNSEELEQLSGGILGACHTTTEEPEEPNWWLLDGVLVPNDPF